MSIAKINGAGGSEIITTGGYSDKKFYHLIVRESGTIITDMTYTKLSDGTTMDGAANANVKNRALIAGIDEIVCPQDYKITALTVTVGSLNGFRLL